MPLSLTVRVSDESVVTLSLTVRVSDESVVVLSLTGWVSDEGVVVLSLTVRVRDDASGGGEGDAFGEGRRATACRGRRPCLLAVSVAEA